MKRLFTAMVALWSLLLAACAVPSVGGSEMGRVYSDVKCDMARQNLAVIARAAKVRLWCDPATADGICHFGQDGFTHWVSVTYGEDGRVFEVQHSREETFTTQIIDHRTCQ